MAMSGTDPRDQHDGEELTLPEPASGLWRRIRGTVHELGSRRPGERIEPHISDASAHRVVSDLSGFVGRQSGHRIVAAGDLNILHGHGEHGSAYWARRFETVFARMSALGLGFVGPQAPNGRQADPWPDELPRDSLNVPTYHTSRQTPTTATRQLDFVFASDGLSDSLTVRALNSPEHWGPSDHCQLEIEIA